MSSNAISNKSNGAVLDGYEERIKKLYSSLTLAQLKATIDGESRQKIPESQYRKKLRQLGLRKYRKASEINGLSSILARKPKESKVFLKGERLPQSEVERMIARSRPDIFTQLSSQLPRGYVIRSPTPDQIEDYTANIPFLEFERALHMLVQNPSYRYLLGDKGISPQLLQDLGATTAGRPESMLEAWNLIPLSLDNTRLLGNTFFANNTRALARLGAVLPFSSIHHQVSGNSPSRQDANIANVSLRRQLFFSIANCFAGIDGFPTWQPFNILQSVSPEIIFQLFRLTKGPTARSIAQSLFKASIESDSHAMVHALLSIEAAGIDVNKEKIFIDNRAYTPVERASSLRHSETIRVLVQHGADVNMTHNLTFLETGRVGALGCAVNTYPCQRLDREAFQLLSNATRAIPFITIMTLTEQQEEDCVLYLIKDQFEKCEWPKFNNESILDVLSEESAIQVIPALIEHGGPRLLKHAINKGYLSLSEKLISDYGMRPDIYDLYTTLEDHRYHNMPFIRRLLSLADPSVHMGNRKHLGETPLSLAISSGDKDLINLMRDVGAFKYLHSWPAFEPAWKAAVGGCNKEIIKELLQLHHNIPRNCVGDLLSLALQEEDNQAAKELIDRGVTGSPFLLRNDAPSEIVEPLLDSGTGQWVMNRILDGAIPKADYSLIRRLLAEGAELPNDALEVALKQRDEKLADFLLEAGACGLNRMPGSFNKNGALFVTAELGDDHLTQYVLHRGADPNDPEALEKAFYTDRTVFDTILAAHKKRYGFRMKDFGSSLLFMAVETKDTALIEKLLQHNADPHGFMSTEGPHQHVTPFGYAIATNNSNDFAMVTQFLNHQCYASDVVSYINHNQGPLPRTTAFLAAIATEDVELVQLLAQSDETIVCAPARRSIKRTALQRAAEIGSFKMVELIRNLGADINEPPNRIGGGTALQLAAIGGFGQIVCYLIQHGADINARGAVRDGVTALVGAAAHGRIDIVALLLNKGAGRGEDGSEQFERAMEEAEYYGHYPTRDYLEERWEAQQKDAPQGPDPVDEFLMSLSDGD